MDFSRRIGETQRTMEVEVYKKLALSQLLAALETLQQTIERTSDEAWYEDHTDDQVNRVVFHTLYYTDLYLCSAPEEFRNQEYHASHREVFRDYEEGENRPPQHQYSREQLRDYYDFCVRKVRRVIGAETDDSLAGPSGFSWRECSRAEVHLYNARHIQHHAAQLGLRHQLSGGPPLRWVGERG